MVGLSKLRFKGLRLCELSGCRNIRWRLLLDLLLHAHRDARESLAKAGSRV